jgi:serpin B
MYFLISKNMKKFVFIFVITALFCSCNKNNSEPQEVLIIKAKSISLPNELRPLVGSGTDFSLRFFKEMSGSSSDHNLFVSPYSLACALGMLYNGAESETKDEIAQVLGMSDYAPELLNAYFQTLTQELLDVDPRTDLGVANAVWSDDAYPVKQGFANLVKTHYDAEVGTMNFSLPASLKAINDWCNKKTKGTIPMILEDLTPPAVLANAVYYKSVWTVPFEKSKTTSKPFYNKDGTKSTVQMMQQKELPLGYTHTTDYEFVRLPYGNEAFAMNILLPKEGVKMDHVLESLDGQTWETLSRAMRVNNTLITLSLPRFSLEGSYELNELLQGMGMPLSFSADADFSAMLEVPASIYKVLQKSYIDVDEKGTEATVVTVVQMDMGSSGVPLPPPPRVTMVVNRSFIFAITEQSTGAILFMGKVTKL